MIPKKIHYCWFGGNEKPQIVKECIDSWKSKCPDYEIIEWNENNFDVNISNYSKEAFDKKKWAFVSDYARLWIVLNHGGIYLDTDVKLIKSLDEVLNYDLFIASENNKYIATGLGFGAKKGNKYVKKMLDDYEELHFVDGTKMDMTPCPIRNTASLKELINHFNMNEKTVYDNIVYYPKQFFNPRNDVTDKIEPTDETIGIHLGLATWQKKRVVIWYNIKVFIKRFLGEKIIKKIKRR